MVAKTVMTTLMKLLNVQNLLLQHLLAVQGMNISVEMEIVYVEHLCVMEFLIVLMELMKYHAMT